MKLRARMSCAGAAGLVLLFAAALRAQTVPVKLQDFLRQYPRFTESDVRALEEGKPVAKVMETQVGNEIALAGAIRIAVPADFFLRQFRDIVRFKQDKAIMGVGEFGNPPTLADLAKLHLGERDVQALRDCRPGNCDVKLSTKEIEEFQKDISWQEPGSLEAANRLFRRVLLRRVEDYLKSGNAGLLIYNDAQSPISLASESGKLLGESGYLGDFAPQLASCLQSFPQCAPNVTSFFYWSKEEYNHRLKPVVSITQVLIDRVKTGSGDWIWAASKQLYADHYSEGSLGMTLMVDAPGENGKPSFYLVYLNRTRSDSMNGFFAFLVRPFLRDRARDELVDTLQRIRSRMERRYAESPDSSGAK